MQNSKYKIPLAIAALILLGIGCIAFSRMPAKVEDISAVGMKDYKNIEYVIDGQSVMLRDGMAETEAAPGSASKISTRYFGNDLVTDLDGDGRQDVVFILTQQTGGSGTFYYVVAARATENGYEGSDGYLLGDRIAPQAIEPSKNPRHVNVIVANYAERGPDESMTSEPSVGKSAYLKLDPAEMQWGIVASDFEGESR